MGSKVIFNIGTRQNLPKASANNNKQFFVTNDSNELYLSNGTEMVKLNNIEVISNDQLAGDLFVNKFYLLNDNGNNVLYYVDLNGDKHMISGTDTTNFVSIEKYNELLSKFNSLLSRVETLESYHSAVDDTDYMYVGRIYGHNTHKPGQVMQYDEITANEIKNSPAVTKMEYQLLDKYSLGWTMQDYEPDDYSLEYFIVAVPKTGTYRVMVDNGIGGRAKFSESTSGTNGGVEIIIDGKEYLLYGQVSWSSDQLFVYIEDI